MKKMLPIDGFQHSGRRLRGLSTWVATMSVAWDSAVPPQQTEDRSVALGCGGTLRF
jgi:hypothetical protein